ncbi:MAG: hypothetical protein K2R98_31055 [Gemmataceae bacterium]|nr:hypothetical protein [Gemmataceae bacterium]
MEPTQELVDSIYRERVLRARRMSFEEKFLAGAELFEEVCQRMADGIRFQFPDADETQVRDILHQRLQLLRRLEGSP